MHVKKLQELIGSAFLPCISFQLCAFDLFLQRPCFPQMLMINPVKINTAPEAKQHTYNFDDAESSFIRRQHKSTEVHTFQSQSPVSVLESSTSSLAGKSLLKPHITKRTRSKRARPSGMSPWLLIAPFLSTSGKTQEAKKTKERRKKLPNPPTEDSGYSSQPSDHASAQPRPTKKCTHCEITKTPQWREGPLGPKTLCNACGVRYRSGRLFPEYRPAASPTFVPSLHSNSHKKVVEMRSKGKKIEGSMSPQLEFIPVSSYLFDPIC